MSTALTYVENYETSEFYPTPPELVERMLEGIKIPFNASVLEPSAGKGDILRVLAKREDKSYDNRYDVDCIEIDPNLRQILSYQFGNRKNEIKKSLDEIKAKFPRCDCWFREGWKYFDAEIKDYVPMPSEAASHIEELEAELKTFFSMGIHIVHDDFLTYNAFKRYDLIVMNPPFSNGDVHLLKALDMQKHGGDIVCLLNAETIRNPYTETRRELQRLLNQYNADIEFVENAFSSAERKTNVEVALIRVHIEEKVEESDIFNHFAEAEDVEDPEYEATALELPDEIKARVNLYNMEVKSGMELIRQYKAMIPYMPSSFNSESMYADKPILVLTVGGKNEVSVNDYLRRVRFKYWSALLGNPKFVGKLTSSLQREYRERVDKLADYEFSEFNIRNLSIEMASRVFKGLQDETLEMFDKLTAEHTWIPQSSNNRLYYDGWKTNKAHKIGKKVIIPCYGVFDSYDGTPRTYQAKECLEDIERVLNYLDGGMTSEVWTMWETIEHHFRVGVTKKIKLKYFEATFYKKGTVHLTFTCPELIDRFNIYAGQHKGWLPPCYGKQAYQNMSDEEKVVIDSFQGEKAYTEVMSKSDYYLAELSAPVTQLSLGSGEYD